MISCKHFQWLIVNSLQWLCISWRAVSENMDAGASITTVIVENERICNSQSWTPVYELLPATTFVFFFYDWTEHGYCYYVAVKAVVEQQSWDAAVRLILVNAMILLWILNSYMKKRWWWGDPGAQSVSLSVETTVQCMNNTLCPLCENFFFLSVHTSNGDVGEKSNSTESTGYFR